MSRSLLTLSRRRPLSLTLFFMTALYKSTFCEVKKTNRAMNQEKPFDITLRSRWKKHTRSAAIWAYKIKEEIMLIVLNNALT